MLSLLRGLGLEATHDDLRLEGALSVGHHLVLLSEVHFVSRLSIK